MLVRTATADDLADIGEILNREIIEGDAHFATEPISSERLKEEFASNHQRYPWFVADEDGHITGFARASPWKSRGAYAWTVEIGVYVRPELHGKGIGASIYESFIPEIAKRGFRTVLAGIALPNPASVRLHERFGFTHVGTLPSVGFKHGRWLDVGYWALNVGTGDPTP